MSKTGDTAANMNVMTCSGGDFLRLKHFEHIHSDLQLTNNLTKSLDFNVTRNQQFFIYLHNATFLPQRFFQKFFRSVIYIAMGSILMVSSPYFIFSRKAALTAGITVLLRNPGPRDRKAAQS